MTITDEPRVQVRSEPATYRPDAPYSFFRDLILSELGGADNDTAAAVARLGRHQAEVAEQRDARSEFEQHARANGFEWRTNPNVTLGTGGEFAPPLWMIDKFAGASRASRPLADLVGSQPLPSGVASINVPRMTTGSTVGIQTDGTPTPGQDLVTTPIAATVQMLAGQLDVSAQLMELTPTGFDQFAYIDLGNAYNKALETQLLTGTGTNGQLLGLSNVTIPANNTVAGAGGNTMTALWPLLGQAAANASVNRGLPVEICMMAPRRWFWMASSLDTSSRPIASPGSVGIHAANTFTPVGGVMPFGPILGVPAYTDGSIANGAAADNVYFLRPADMFLWEGPPKVITSVQAISGTLQVRLSLHRAVAWMPHRYPTGIGVVTAVPAPASFQG